MQTNNSFKSSYDAFDSVAADYEKMRPGYPTELYQDIFSHTTIDSSSNVMEIGIGGGQATLPFLQKGCQLVAVEYGEKLAYLCRNKFHDFSNFSVVNSKFEDYEGEHNAYDLIYSATAFHWIPEKVGYQKVYQMLKKGGVFARFANHPYGDKDKPELDQAIQKLYTKYMTNAKRTTEFNIEDAKRLAEIATKYGFVNKMYKLYHRTRTFQAKEYIALLGTYSDHLALEEEIRIKFFGEIETVINQFGGEITIYDTIDLEICRKEK